MIPRRPFYFLRHGQTDWNHEGRYQGRTDVPLNATGIAQAETAARQLATVRIDRIVASPLIRALKTAAIVAEARRLPIFIEPRLVERHFGSFDGLVIREIKQRYGVPLCEPAPGILPPDADPWDEIHARVPPTIARWMIDFPQESLLFVAHGGVFDAVHEHLIGPRAGGESMHASPYRASPNMTGWEFAHLGGDAA